MSRIKKRPGNDTGRCWMGAISFRPFICAHLIMFLQMSAGAQQTPASVPSTPEQSGSIADAPSAEIVKARNLIQQNRYDAAIAALKELERKQPSVHGAAHQLGVAYYKKTDYASALSAFKRALEQDP